jgi:hypothetical protein
MKIILLLIALLFLNLCMVGYAQDLEYVGSYATTFSKWIHVENDIACVLDSSNILILNVSVPANPVFLGSIHLPGNPVRFDIQGNFIYVACEDSGMTIVDISEPTSPMIIERFLTSHPARYVIVSDSVCFLLDDRKLSLLNILSPGDPQVMGHLDFVSILSGGLAIRENVAYIIGDYGEFELLFAFDIADPANPVRIAWTLDDWGCSNLYVINNSLFVVNGQYQFLRRYDISAPDTFIVLAFAEISGLTNVTAASGYLYGSSTGGGVNILDISNPDTCIEIGFHETLGSSKDVFSAGNLLYVADSSSIQILRIYSTAISNGVTSLGESFPLGCYPNPFNAQTTIQYSLPKTSDITIDIFDILGRRIATLTEGVMPAGNHQATWDASRYSSGIYFYRLKAAEYTETKRMLLLK